MPVAAWILCGNRHLLYDKVSYVNLIMDYPLSCIIFE